MMKALRSVLPFVFVSFAAAAVAEWPQFRGPERDGVSPEKGLLKEWPAEGPALAWQIKGIGRGLASVAISDGKLYTVAKRPGGQFVVAIDLATQKESWSTLLSEKGDDPQGAPSVNGGLVYAVSKDGRVLCCRATDGKEIWRKDFAKDFGGKMMSGWGYSESPLVDGDKVIVTPGGNDAVLVALNKTTGELIWKAPLPAGMIGKGNDGAGYTGAVVSNAGGVRQYVTLIGHGVLSVAAADGKPLWHYDRIANGTANIPTPLAWDDYVFASTGYGAGAALLKIEAARGGGQGPSKADAQQAVELSKKVDAFTQSLATARAERDKASRGAPEYAKADEAVQSAKKDLAAAERDLAKATGAGGDAEILGSPLQVKEQYFLNASTFQNHHGGMVRLGDYIYAGVGHNNGFPLCLEWKTGKVAWKKDRGPGTESAALIAADGRLYFRYQNGIVALIDASPDGYTERGAFKLPSVDGPSWSHPAICDGRLYLRDQDTLMCYDIRQK